MSVIHKYSLTGNTGVQVVTMPSGAEIISAAAQYNILKIWAIVDPEMPTVPRNIAVYMTGQTFDTQDTTPLPRKPRFIDTVQLYNGDFIMHVFDLGESR